MPTNIATATGADLRELAEDFRRDGYAVVPGFAAGALLEQLRREAAELLDAFTSGRDRSADYWCYEVPGAELPMLYRVHNLENRTSGYIPRFLAERTAHTLAEAFFGAGAEASATVCAMIVKTPGVAEVPWHRDRVDAAPGTALNVSVFLDDSSAANGCLEVIPGSHLLTDDADVEAVRASRAAVAIPTRAGDALVHDVRLVHGSAGNTSDLIRRSVITELVASGPDR